jgi:tetratricopeptide (TPR) repeat protein
MSAPGASALGSDRPFPGLRPFAHADQDYFFGRTDQIYALYRMIDRGRFVAVIGSSGSGKSSLVFAGLLPLLDKERREAGGRQWVWRDMSPGDDPIDRLIDLLHGLATELQPDSGSDAQFAASQRDRIAYLIRYSSRGLVEALAEIEGLQNKTLVLVIDQFEELFRYATSTQLRDRGKEFKWREEAVLFVQLLLVASRDADCKTRFMLTMRSDFIGDCARFHGLPEAVSGAQFLVPSLRRDQLEEIICKPIAKAGGSIDPMLVKRLLTDGSDDFDQLPVLQHCLSRLWEQAELPAAAARPDNGQTAAEFDPNGVAGGRHLTLEHYERIKRMTGGLSQHADEILSTDLAGLTPVVAQVFRALSELDRDGRAIRRAVPFAQLAAETAADEGVLCTVIDRLRADDCAFLRPSPIKIRKLSSETTVDVGHEALLRRWEKVCGVAGATGEPNDPRPIGWMKEEDADGRRYQALLSIVRNDRAGRTILSPEQLEWWDKRHPTLAWAGRYGGSYTLVERLIENSRAALASEQQRQEREKAAQRLARRMWFAVPALVLLLLLAGGAGYEINKEKNIAEANSQRATEQANLATKLFSNLLGHVLNALNSGSISVMVANYIFKPVEDYFAQLKDAKLTTEVMEFNVQLLTTYSDVQVSLGQNENALNFARQAKVMAQQLVAKDGQNDTWQYLLYSALFRTADAVIARGESAANLHEGLVDYQRAQTIAQKLRNSKADDGGRQYDLAFIDNKVGETLQLQYEMLNLPDKMAEAMTYFNAALQIARIIAEKVPGQYEWKAHLPITLTKIGSAMASQSLPDLNGALAQYAEALTLQKSLAEHYPDNVSILSNQARTQGLVGDILVRRNGPGDFEASRKAYQDAIAINEALLKRDPSSALWLGDLSAKYARFGTALKEHGDLRDALAIFAKELPVRQKLVDKDPNKVTWQKNLKWCRDRIDALNKMIAATGSVTAPHPAKTVPEKVESAKALAR